MKIYIISVLSLLLNASLERIKLAQASNRLPILKALSRARRPPRAKQPRKLIPASCQVKSTPPEALAQQFLLTVLIELVPLKGCMSLVVEVDII